MLDLIFALKFVHVLAVAAIVGGWLCLAIFMVMAHRASNTAVVALTSRFVVKVELMVMAAAMAILPLSGFPLAYAIGLSPLNEFWIVASSALYIVIAACWLLALRIEMRIRDLTREAALASVPLSDAYRRLFRRWCGFAVPLSLGMLAVFALMIWQPRFD
jgi:uncharacterized membrane protein